jgi:hypothetical protein
MLHWLTWGFFLLGCEEEEVNYNQFNGTTDTIDVSVGVDEELPPTEVNLLSSTGLVVVGTATINPAGGPIGTRHLLVVEVDNQWENRVSRVVVTTDAGDRGTEEFTLQQDSADAGYHQIEIVSVGVEGETRTDTLTISLYTEDGINWETVDTGSQ